ncbi:unnamed protein product [Arctia plantaginis]|uniref:Uncharacterized protein n=1 Tax=Arctia plantaginis TaxID=874455 RepID=A0A8S0ZG78_ARCPL|nr:unnamed protein product [Arctia plantaginis]CAB3252393.1 unnamed protein product [Arctia plantaginis]
MIKLRNIVSDIVHDGGIYLEGLRKALEDYSRFLEECRKENASMSQNSNSTWMPPDTPSRGNISTILNLRNPQNFNTSDWTMTTRAKDSAGISRRIGNMSCREASEASESVRRYADLAMWATKRLQDIAYAKGYQETEHYEENELILKLAWFLDQLALLTGYEPDYSQYLTRRSSTTSTTSPTPPTLVPQTQELTNILINCIKANSSVPAVDRCRYPLPVPATVGEPTSVPSPRSDVNAAVPIANIDSQQQQSMEILITGDDYRTPRRITKRSTDEYFVPIAVHEKPKPVVDFIVKKLSNLKAIVKSVKKHAVADFISQLAYHKHLHRRAIDDNTSVLLNQVSGQLPLKLIVKSDESNDQQHNTNNVEKMNQSIVKPDESIAKSDNPILKSDDSIVNNDKSTIEVLSLKQFPILDASVVNTKSFKKRSISNSGRSYNLLNRLTFQKAPVKVAVDTVKKRSVGDPLSKLTKYYIKHKVWDNSNPALESSKKPPSNFELNNNLKTKFLTKRSLVHKKTSNFMLPRPFRHSNLKKHKHSHKKSKLQFYLNNLLEIKYKKMHKTPHKITKRSIKYEHMYLPRIPTSPVEDISYYVKTKPGRNYNPSLTQAAQVRLGLQQIFETGNILVIQRYGSNYNPAVQDAFTAGVLKGLADS